jgi:signal peptidase I
MADLDASYSPPWWQVFIVGRNPKVTLIRLLITVVLVFIGFRASVQGIRVTGISMAPTFVDGQTKYVNKLSLKFSPPRRGDVMAVQLGGSHVLLLKRVIALPGERIRIDRGQVFIDDEPLPEPYLRSPGQGLKNPAPWNVPEVLLENDEYYVIGDNRSMPRENHDFGRVKSRKLLGRLF